LDGRLLRTLGCFVHVAFDEASACLLHALIGASKVVHRADEIHSFGSAAHGVGLHRAPPAFKGAAR